MSGDISLVLALVALVLAIRLGDDRVSPVWTTVGLLGGAAVMTGLLATVGAR